jgi:hypothetical protein
VRRGIALPTRPPEKRQPPPLLESAAPIPGDTTTPYLEYNSLMEPVKPARRSVSTRTVRQKSPNAEGVRRIPTHLSACGEPENLENIQDLVAGSLEAVAPWQGHYKGLWLAWFVTLRAVYGPFTILKYVSLKSDHVASTAPVILIR